MTLVWKVLIESSSFRIKAIKWTFWGLGRLCFGRRSLGNQLSPWCTSQACVPFLLLSKRRKICLEPYIPLLLAQNALFFDAEVVCSLSPLNRHLTHGLLYFLVESKCTYNVSKLRPDSNCSPDKSLASTFTSSSPSNKSYSPHFPAFGISLLY